MATLYAWFDDEYVAKMRGVRGELREVAHHGGARAQAVLDTHYHEGHAKITVTRGDKLDWFVNLDDTRGDHAAYAIEFGRSGGANGETQGVFALHGAF